MAVLHFQKLERVENVRWRLLYAQYHHHVQRPLVSQASHTLGGGGQQKQSIHHFGVGEQHTGKSNHCGTSYRAKIGCAFHNHILDPHLSSSRGCFLPVIIQFCSKRSLTTQDDYDDEGDSEIDASSTSMSDHEASHVASCGGSTIQDDDHNEEGDSEVDPSDANMLESDALDDSFPGGDTIDKAAVNQQRQQLKAPSPIQFHHSDEEDYDNVIIHDELEVGNPLDAASANLVQGMCDQRRPLWKRLQEAAAGGKPSYLKDTFDEWTAEGNELSKAVIVSTITTLRKQRRYWRALEVSDWVLRGKPFELNDMDYGIRVELIAKLQGTRKATEYFATIPKAFKTSMVYSILLTAYAQQNKEKEAVSLLQEAEKLGLGHRTYMYNQLLYLYKKNGLMAGVAEVLKTMEERKVDPNIFTYNILLDVRARKGDTNGMEKVWDYIKVNDTVEPNAATYSVLAKGFLIAGQCEKAEEMVEKIAESPLRRTRTVNLMLLRLYGDIGKEDQLERVWGLVCEGSRVGTADYLTMIRSLGKVGNCERAEDLFEEMEDKCGKLTVNHYNALLSAYARAGRTQRGEILLKNLAKAKLQWNTATYHELVLMYLKAGQEQKALEILSAALKGSRTSTKNRPMYATFQAALDWFAEKGNVKGAEKVVRDLKSTGYACAYRSYLVLLKAYENGHMSPYGFIDRLKSDNVIPNQQIREQLKILDGT